MSSMRWLNRGATGSTVLAAGLCAAGAVGTALTALQTLLLTRSAAAPSAVVGVWPAAAVGSALVVAVGAVALTTRVRSEAVRTTSLLQALRRVNSGDLTIPLQSCDPDQIGDVVREFAVLVSRLESVVLVVDVATDALGLKCGEIRGLGEDMKTAAQRTSVGAIDATSSADVVAQNIGIVAQATRRLTETLREVAAHASDASTVATTANDQAELAAATIGDLNNASEKIKDVVTLISSIAGETHLLALNATIEAARAGELGHGFAVVASEVKTLAHQTAEATGNVAETVAGVRQGSDLMSQTINEITVTMSRVRENQSAIAQAAAVQTENTLKISQLSAEAAAGSAGITRSIADVSTSASVIAVAADHVLAVSDHLVMVQTELRELSAKFELGQVERTPMSFGIIRTTTVENGVRTVPNAVAGTGLHEWNYTGTWSMAHAAAGTEQDSNSYCSGPGDTAVLRFEGSRLTFYGFADFNHGIAYLSVDDGPEVAFDEYAAERCLVSWRSPVLAAGVHTFSVRCSTDRNPLSDYHWATIDRVEIT